KRRHPGATSTEPAPALEVDRLDRDREALGDRPVDHEVCIGAEREPGSRANRGEIEPPPDGGDDEAEERGGDTACADRDRESDAEAAHVDRAVDELGDRESDQPPRDELPGSHAGRQARWASASAMARASPGLDPSVQRTAAAISSR